MELIEKTEIIKYDNGILAEIEDDIIIEYPFTIFLNGEELITFLCSPNALEYLAVGFLISEGMIKKGSDIVSLRLMEDRGIIEVETHYKKSLSQELFGKRTMTTGCGKGTTFYHINDSFQSKIITTE